MTDKKCIKCGKVIIKDFEKWKQDNPKKCFAYCPKCQWFVPVMRKEGVDI